MSAVGVAASARTHHAARARRRAMARVIVDDAERQRWLDTKLMRSGEVALLLHMSPRTVTEWARDGRIPFIVTPGGHRRFRARDVRGLLDVMHAPLAERA